MITSDNWLEFRMPWERPIRDLREYESQIKSTARELKEAPEE